MRSVCIYIALAIALCSCAKPEATVVFKATQCITAPTEELRERRVRTTCAMRHGSMNPNNPTKICLSWNHKNITERRTTLQCSRDQWVEASP